MIKREPFKPTIRKEDFLSEEKYLIGVEHYSQSLFLPALTIEEIVDLQLAISNFLSEKRSPTVENSNIGIDCETKGV